MEHLETQISNKSYNPDKEPKTAFDFESYKRKAVEEFDASVFDINKNITPISGKPSAVENSGRIVTGKTKARSIDEIYFEPDFTSAQFGTALKLLAGAINYCKLSIAEHRQDNLIASDDAIHHVQALLPELFSCRNLSESFGAIINSIQNALINNRGQMLSERKLLALNEILTVVRNEPFMKFDKAVDVIMAFEDCDFTVEPMGFDFLTELFDE
jgi:hypothetical protein